MPKIVLKPQSSGLVQETGGGVVFTPSTTESLTANGLTLSFTGSYGSLLRPVDAGGTARTGLILASGTSDGQVVVLQNRGGEDLDFAAQATSLMSGSTGSDRTLNPGTTVMLVWDNDNSVWCPTSQTLS